MCVLVSLHNYKCNMHLNGTYPMYMILFYILKHYMNGTWHMPCSVAINPIYTNTLLTLYRKCYHHIPFINLLYRKRHILSSDTCCCGALCDPA